MKESTKTKNNIININEGLVKNHLGKIVKDTVEETLNALLDAEADEICNAKRYERNKERKDTRAGHYTRNFETKAGSVELKMPKLRNLPFETSIIDRYRRRESSVEEALIEMYLAGVSVRKVEDITEALWGSKVSAGTISNLNKKVYSQIEEWRNKKISGKHPFVYLDGTYLKKCWGGQVRSISILVAIGVNQDGYREILGVAEGAREDKESWLEFMRYLKKRGLCGVKMVISDKCLGLVESLGNCFPNASWQRCMVHFYRNIASSVPHNAKKEVMAMAKAIFAQEDKEASLEKTNLVIKKLKKMKLQKASDILKNGIEETLTYMSFPSEYSRKIRTNNPLERLNKEIKRRTKVVGSFPDGESALMLVAARLRYVSTKEWGTKKYLNMEHLNYCTERKKLA